MILEATKVQIAEIRGVIQKMYIIDVRGSFMQAERSEPREWTTNRYGVTVATRHEVTHTWERNPHAHGPFVYSEEQGRTSNVTNLSTFRLTLN